MSLETSLSCSLPPTTFLPQDAPALEEIGESSSVQVDQNQTMSAHEPTSQQVQQFHLLNQINSEIHSTLDLNQGLAAVCRLLGESLNCNQVNILISESEDQDWLVHRAEYSRTGDSQQLGTRVSLTQPDLQVVIAQPETLAIAPASELLQSGEPSELLSPGSRAQSVLSIATRYQGQVNGMIQLHHSDRQWEWTAGERQLLQSAASQLAIAINQFHLYAEVAHRAERESLLRLVISQIRRTLDLDTILQTVVQEVRQLLNTDRVVIYQFSENWQGTVVVEDVLPPWDSVLGEIGQDDCFSSKYADFYCNGRVRAINHILQAGLNDCHVSFLQRLQVQANLIVPIIIGTKLWGLLLAHECRNPRVWQAWEMELLQQLADQIAIAIQQAELYTQVQTSATQFRAQAQQLQTALQELQQAQMKLIQSEKLSSLGQMVAGIAHEINNATTFIHANLPYAQQYATLFEQVIADYEAAYPDSAAEITQLTTKNAEIDLAFARRDFPKLLQSMQVGTDRIREIVLTLRNFARLDEAEQKPVDLHEGIESSLVILQHRMRMGVNLRKQYGALPLVECHAGQINQVFLNLLSNALDAINNAGEITVRTWQPEPDKVAIAICDNGCGIPAEIQPRIFDPFFTTKAIGAGTGLGLSICHQIIVRGHGGQIYCISHPGQETEFRVELPLMRRQDGEAAR